MSLVITGTDLIVVLVLLIALNGFFSFIKIPILSLPIAGISVIFLIGFQIDFSGINIILTLILLVCIIVNVVSNIYDYRK